MTRRPSNRSALRAADFPRGARAVVDRLHRAGAQAFFVGGCVRDLLLGRPARDHDMATDLLPEQVLALFPRAVMVGAAFGTVVVPDGDESYEVTTFRRDGIYADGRHPERVEYGVTIDEDLTRRDFTVNALAFDPFEEGLLDPSGGIADLASRTIRAVGNPETRFAEDGLRLLRAARLATQLDFEVERETLAAMVRLSDRVDRISMERVRDEFTRLVLLDHPAAGIALLNETGILRRFLPELSDCYGVPQNPHHAYDVFHHSLAALNACASPDLVVRLAALFHDLGKPATRVQLADTASFHAHQIVGERITERVLRRLRYPNEIRERVVHLVRHHMFHYTPEWTDGAIRRFLRDVGPENLDTLYAMRAADTLGNGLRRRLAPELTELRRRSEEILARDAALSVRDLAIGGTELMAEFSLGPGPWIGAVLRALLEDVLDDPLCNERSILLDRARRLLEGLASRET